MNTPAPTPAVATCDDCAQLFEIRNQAEAVDGGELQFFVCPHCGRRYEYAFVTGEGVHLRGKLASLRKARSGHDSDKLRRLYDKTLADYRQEVQSRLHPLPIQPDPYHP